MGELLSYSIVSGVMLLAMYLAYRLFMARDNQHGFNRGVLLAVYAVAFLTMPVVGAIERLAAPSASQVPVVTDGVVSAGMPAAPAPQPVWGTVLIWVFLAGMAVVLVKTAVTWVRLSRVIRSGEKVSCGGYTLVVTDDGRYAPFSWMRYVVISRADYRDNCPAIVAHELEHVDSRHWIDLLVAQAVCIVNWFNPAAWLMRDELMLVHEYQADMAVIDAGHDAQEYQMLLIEKAVGSRFPSLANSLNHSKLKKRITMMYKEKSGAGRKFKALALVPMLALAVGVTSVPAVRAAVSTIRNSAVSVSEVSENPSDDKINVQTFRVININKDGRETTVTVRGEGLGNHLTVSGGTFTTDGKSYQARSLQCDMTDGVATIVAKFKLSGDYKKPALNLTINGADVPFNLEDFFNDSQIVVVGYGAVEKSGTPVSALNISGEKSDASDDVTVFLDGNQISEAEMNALPPDDIASVTVDKQANTIIIHSKGAAGAQPGEIEIYLDDKKISEAEMNALDPAGFESVTVDRNTNTVKIVSKK